MMTFFHLPFYYIYPSSALPPSLRVPVHSDLAIHPDLGATVSGRSRPVLPRSRETGPGRVGLGWAESVRGGSGRYLPTEKSCGRGTPSQVTWCNGNMYRCGNELAFSSQLAAANPIRSRFDSGCRHTFFFDSHCSITIDHIIITTTYRDSYISSKDRFCLCRLIRGGSLVPLYTRLLSVARVDITSFVSCSTQTQIHR